MMNCSEFRDKILDRWKYIECHQGPQAQEIVLAIVLTCVNSVLFITGLIGNLLLCVVVIKHPLLNTPTDYFLLNLALSDLLLLIFGLPYEVSLYWHLYPTPLGQFACQLRSLIAEMASCVSVLTIVSFSTERYLAICYPLKQFAISNLERSIKVMIAIWITALVCAIPFAVQTKVHYIKNPQNLNENLPESAICGMMSQPDGIPLTEISSIIFFFFPMVIIVYQYTRMGLVLRKVSRSGNIDDGQIHGRKRKSQLQSKNIIKMLALVVLGFFLCWSPFHFQRIASVYLKDYQFFYEINHWIFFVSGILYYFSSTMNPILYNVMSERMRNAFEDVILGNVRMRKKNSGYSTTTTREISRETNSFQLSRRVSTSEWPESVHLFSSRVQTETV